MQKVCPMMSRPVKLGTRGGGATAIYGLEEVVCLRERCAIWVEHGWKDDEGWCGLLAKEDQVEVSE